MGDFLSTITRNTILVIISISFSFVNVISFAVVNYYSNTTLYSTSSIDYIQHFMFLADVCTNFICVILTINLFSSQYYGLCGLLDARCKLFCGNMIQKGKKSDIELGSKSPHSAVGSTSI